MLTLTTRSLCRDLGEWLQQLPDLVEQYINLTEEGLKLSQQSSSA